MLYDRILVKYGELTIKGRNKKQFINKIIQTIKKKCKRFPNLKYINKHQRFYILLNGEDHEEVIKALNQVFGLHAYSLNAKCESNIDVIKQLALQIAKEEIIGNKTFKVETKRADKSFPMQSLEVSKEVASHVLRETKNLTVDVKNPQVKMQIEIREEGTFISTNEIKGLGGLPVGMDGKGLLMLSGGIDSPVAGFLIQKRGVDIEALHFSSPPYTSERAKQKVIDLSEILAYYSPNDNIRIHNVPFTKIQKAIYDHCPHGYLVTIMRRMMYRIAEKIANKNGILILANGENVGQVASQTLQSMNVINEVTSMPIIRPVATMDKLEIIDIAKKIDTYKISIRPYEDCCTIFIPKNPATKPDLNKCIEYEQAFDYETLIEEAIKDIEVIDIQVGKQDNFETSQDIKDLF